MKCQYCACPDSRVIDSRPVEDGNAIRRRRECAQCGRRFTTYEKMERMPLLVVKKDARREPFDSQKIRNGIVRACQKRPVSVEDIDSMVNRVEQAVYSANEGEITTRQIGEYVMAELKRVDEVAYVRFASVYRQFTDVGSFMEELTRLIGERQAETPDRDAEKAR